MKTKQLNIYITSCFIVAALKMWLIAKNEIVSMPYDAEAYVTRAINGLWEIGVVHSGYPIWLYLTQQVGLPQRISIEILYLSSCFFVFTTSRAYTYLSAALLLFIILAFAPFTYFLFDQAVTDGFYLCLTLFAVGFSLRILDYVEFKMRRVAIYAFGLGVTLGIMLLTRAEDQLVVSWIFVVVGLFSVVCRRENDNLLTLKFWRKPFYVLLVISVSSLVVVNIVCTVFYVRSGVFGRSLTLLPGHYKLLERLALIDPGISQHRYIPISSVSRKLAYGVSPTLSSLRDEVENPNNVLQAASRKAELPSGEIGAGWIWGIFLGAMYKTTPNPNAVKCEDKFKKMHAELDAAFADGRLKKRFIINQLIGGNIEQLVRDWPSSAFAVLKKILSSYAYVSDQTYDAEIFDKVCLRRAALTGRRNHIILQGWAFPVSPGIKILLVMPRRGDGNYGKAKYIERLDVSDGVGKSSGWKPEVYGFRADIEANSLEDVTLRYFFSDGTMIESNSFIRGQVRTILNKANDSTKVVECLDIAEVDSPFVRKGIRHEMQKKLARYIASSGSVLLVSTISIGFFIFSILVIIKRKYDIFRSVFVFQVFITLIFALRLLFYSLIETASWHVEIRYLASAQALLVAFISVSLATICAAARDLKRSN